MKRITLTQEELEKRVERALENACAYSAMGNFKLMLEYKGEADTYLGLLEDMDVWYDDGETINEHVQGMLDVLHDDRQRLQLTRN